MTWTAPLPAAPTDEPFGGAERPMLDGFLDWHRQRIHQACAGLTGAQLVARSCPPSTLSLLGIVRHLSDVERTWLCRRFAGMSDVDSRYWRPDNDDGAFDDTDPARAAQELAALAEDQAAARRAVADLSLEHVFVSPRWGEMTLRWGYLHLIREYAGHGGHADLLRDRW